MFDESSDNVLSFKLNHCSTKPMGLKYWKLWLTSFSLLFLNKSKSKSRRRYLFVISLVLYNGPNFVCKHFVRAIVFLLELQLPHIYHIHAHIHIDTVVAWKLAQNFCVTKQFAKFCFFFVPIEGMYATDENRNKRRKNTRHCHNIIIWLIVSE